MRDALPARVRFGVFELDLKSGELRAGDQRTVLQEQSLQILRMLIERPGELLSREEIRKKLWPNDTVVEFDHSINAAIRNLRRALADSADEPNFIETIARRGYRFMVPVERAAGAEDLAGEMGPEASDDGVAALMPPGVLTGKAVSHYRVLDVIGGGGMGVVYRAEDLKLGRRVALKFLPEEFRSDSRALERFEREARAASALDHPNICSIYEFGEHEGRPFIVMQLLEGQTLRDRMAAVEDNKALPLEELMDIAIQVSAGLQAAHDKGIIHRDIKPANILITNKGVAKILDFGLAKLLEGGEEDEVANRAGIPAVTPPAAPEAANLTLTGVALGTAGYMSPEQVRGDKLDARTDLFSLGLVLYEMATGQRAFSGQSAAMLHDAILNRAPAPARELSPEISPGFEAVINKALEKDRGRRYQAAADLGNDLQRLKSATDLVRTVTLGKGKRRWPVWVAGLLTALLAGLAVAWFGWRRVEKPSELAERQLTANPSEDWVTGAAISPDGKFVAYHDQTGVYIRAIESGENHAVTLPAALRGLIWHLCWSPAGGELVADAWDSGAYDVWVIPILGEAEPHLLYRHGYEPAVSPDGRTIAFLNWEYGKEEQEVLVGGMNGEAPRKLVEVGPQQNVFGPVWSPDGRWIAYTRRWTTAQGSQGTAIEVLPAGGGSAKTLVTASSLSPNTLRADRDWVDTIWSPDWRLLFSVGDGAAVAKFSLWQVRVDPGTGEAAGKPGRLTHWNELNPSSLAITADGRRLALLKWQDWRDVYLGELGSGGASIKAPRRLTLDNRGSRLAAWARDSQAIFFESSRNGKMEIFRQSLNENVAEMLVAASSVEVSPDGNWFVYQDPTRPGLQRRAVAGGRPPELIVDDPREMFNYACSLDPKASSPCVLALREGNDVVFYSLDPVRGKGRWLGKIEVTGPFMGIGISPDGSGVAFVDEARYAGRIQVLSLLDGTWHEISTKLEGESLQTIGWAADGRGFFASGVGSTTYDLLHVALDGRVQPLSRSLGQQYWGPRVSPDGKYLAFDAFTRDSNVWLIDSF
jgi:eukaryotic-like serine/threonine-protein kinase